MDEELAHHIEMRTREFVEAGMALALDVVTFAAAATVVLLLAALASLVPARRSARVDPSVALRAEWRGTLVLSAAKDLRRARRPRRSFAALRTTGEGDALPTRAGRAVA